MLKFFKNESGATLVEYGVALVLAISLGGGALTLLADDVGVQMSNGCDAMVPTTPPTGYVDPC